MIQDIKPAVFRNEYNRMRAPADTDIVFVFDDKTVLAKACEGGSLAFPTVREWTKCRAESADVAGTALQYLFEIDGRAFFLAEEERLQNKPAPDAVAAPTAAGSGVSAASAEAGKNIFEVFGFLPVRRVRNDDPRDLCFACETAYQLYGWYRDNRFCGRCGGRMARSEKERCMICPSCGNHVYPKIMPAVIVGVINPARDAILMTQYAGRAYKGHALIAGFNEIGETGEDTVRREVMEEAGIRVKNIRYYKSQPWGFDADLLLGYFCEVDGDDMIHMDDGELAKAVWVPRKEITDVFENMSLTNEMITVFKDGT